jgi:hypothetical protein
MLRLVAAALGSLEQRSGREEPKGLEIFSKGRDGGLERVLELRDGGFGEGL